MDTAQTPFEGGACGDVRFLYVKAVSRQIMIVLGIGNRALESFPDQEGRFLGCEIERVNCVGYGKALNLTGHIPRLLGRDPGIFVNRTNFHD